MKKQLFIAMLASALLITSVPMAAFANTQPTSSTIKSASTSTTNSAISVTEPAIKTTDASITTTNSAVSTDVSTTAPAIKVEAKEPEVVSPIKLTLDSAYKKMLADSPQSIIAKYTLDNELAIGRGYSENISKLNRAERASDLDPNSWGVDTSNKASLQACRNFANSQAPKNYDATMNALKHQTYEMYYNYKYVEAQVQVAKDNLTRVQSVYNSTILQYKVGKVSKLDTLTAETNLNEAKDNYQKAVNGFEQVKMSFNIFMGYNIHQPVTLTDTLTSIAFPTKSIDTAIKEALSNRNEIVGAKYRTEITALAFNNVKNYPSSSATYKQAQVAVKMAEEALKSAPGKVEIDVRTKYMDMKQKYDAVQFGKISYENSKEASRLGQLQFENGFITVTDLSGINLNTFNTQQAYYKAILDYNLAVSSYELSTGVGTDAASIQ